MAAPSLTAAGSLETLAVYRLRSRVAQAPAIQRQNTLADVTGFIPFFSSPPLYRASAPLYHYAGGKARRRNVDGEASQSLNRGAALERRGVRSPTSSSCGPERRSAAPFEFLLLRSIT